MQRLIVYLVFIVLVLSYVIDGLKIDNRKKVVRNNANKVALRTKVNFTRNHTVRPVFKFSTTNAPKAIFSTVKRGELTATNKLPITDLELADAEARGNLSIYLLFLIIRLHELSLKFSELAIM